MPGTTLGPQVASAYAALEQSAASSLLDAVDDALDALQENPAHNRFRRRNFRGGKWGITVRDRTEDWVVIWEYDPAAEGAVYVRYLGPDPFA